MAEPRHGARRAALTACDLLVRITQKAMPAGLMRPAILTVLVGSMLGAIGLALETDLDASMRHFLNPVYHERVRLLWLSQGVFPLARIYLLTDIVFALAYGALLV